MVSVYCEPKINQCEIPGSDSSAAEDSGQVFDALSLGKQFPVFLWSFLNHTYSQWRTEGGFGGFKPPPEIPKALQNHAKLNPIVKTVKNS